MGPPEGVRPTSDRVREAVFGKLGDVAGAHVLDLFAGTGALAIEALSRGAESALLVDAAAASVRVIARNLEALGLAERTQVMRGEAVRVCRRLAGRPAFDLVFLDPPYDSDRLPAALRALVENGLLAPRATVVVETAKRHPLARPDGLEVAAEKDYGDTRVTWLSPQAPSSTRARDFDGDERRT